MKRTVLLAALFTAGCAAALTLSVQPANAWEWTSLPNGYSIRDLNLGGGCHEITVNGHLIGSTCDPGFQVALDAYVNSTICTVNPAAGGSACAPPATSTAPPTTTAVAPVTTTAAAATAAPPTTTTPAPAPTPPATTTVTTPAPAPAATAPPFSDFTAATTNPLVIAFTDASTAGTAAIATRYWQFGDGTSAFGPTASHAYAAPGSYFVTLDVRDANGLSSIAGRTLTIAADKTIVLGPRQTQGVVEKANAIAKAKTAAKAKAQAAARAKAAKAAAAKRAKKARGR